MHRHFMWNFNVGYSYTVLNLIEHVLTMIILLDATHYFNIINFKSIYVSMCVR